MCHVRELNTVAKAAATVVTRVHCRCFVASKNEKSPLLPSLSLSFSFFHFLLILDARSSLSRGHSPGRKEENLLEKKKKFVRSDDYKKKTCGKRALWFLRSILLYFYVLLISFRAHTSYLWSTINSPFLSLFRLAL